MALTTPDTVEFTQDSDTLVYVDVTTPAGLAILPTDSLILDAAATSLGDGHEISFYHKDVSTQAHRVCGFNRTYGFIVNTSLVLVGGASLTAPQDLALRHAGTASTADLRLSAKDSDLVLEFGKGGSGSGSFEINGTAAWSFLSSGRIVLHGDVLAENTFVDIDAILRIPVGTSNPSWPQEGELYYHSSTRRIRTYVDGAWYQTAQFT